MNLTRRQLLAGAAGVAALGSAGIYELVDQLSSSPARPPANPPQPEQHLLDGLRVVRDNGVEVIVPPLHHQVVTARVRVAEARRYDLRAAQAELEYALHQLGRRFEPTPAGLGVTVAWGLPYFERFVPGQARKHLPFDRRAGKSALLDAIRFPSDPDDTILEGNDVAVLLRSDALANVKDASRALFEELDLLEPTSIRRGFAGGGFEGERSLPKQMALAANIPGADLIPDNAELFLGFTSTQKAGLGPGTIANHETLGFVDLRGGYFRNGTHMHLSHLDEDVEAWYLNFDFRERVDTAFRPNLDVAPGTQTVPQPADESASERDVRGDFRRTGRIGHSGAIQTTSRLARDTLAADGTFYPKGTAIPQRADFNTLDNPFAWSAQPARDRMAEGPSAGVHFVVFNPSSDDFHRNRLAMDGVLPGGKLPLEPRARGQGFNAVLRTTHRQNFLVPPRRHRSFPLAELAA